MPQRMDIKTPLAVEILPEIKTRGGGDMVILTLLKKSVKHYSKTSTNPALVILEL